MLAFEIFGAFLMRYTIPKMPEKIAKYSIPAFISAIFSFCELNRSLFKFSDYSYFVYWRCRSRSHCSFFFILRLSWTEPAVVHSTVLGNYLLYPQLKYILIDLSCYWVANRCFNRSSLEGQASKEKRG